ncbi:uncharacterized protein LAESUDRAFT_746733 [Laetiporus sulphureus 93-53]|uniref:Telomere-associated protein Rif1 N-terminal domain-containing protein n=1 Tax=Laetiporus sulphureus 93-53 TaxID=1314785 RepID=A0A165HN08_9APHY|nr:uncharacterized protein LAESUDRAFT_746733 [Laetiporus sulphureus 93-53]KZT11950.1 hypothetical protein LAESUDRAFT_746733 [Laetiporus sulphureus 93-53]
MVLSWREQNATTSLPTPPSTSHRDKENRPLRLLSNSRVAWSDEHQYHTFGLSPPPVLSIQSSASRVAPSKSILKRTDYLLLPLFDDFKKEVTPEPADPLVDLHYLEGPVSRMLAADAPLPDLIEAYSVLAARLKSCVSGVTDADGSWPLFQPLRQYRDTFVDALVRDLQRIFDDPSTVKLEELSSEEEIVTGLLSPKESPKKKRGMTAEQVKFARDLCTVCHAVLKLLNVMFTSPSIFHIFSDEQLRFIMTQVLAIPLAKSLPTPNARKTCALAVWLIQTQRLSSNVLNPAKDRIAYALRRAIEGELGKEGKKGSINDGLKAIHELSQLHPSVFVPAFTELLPAMLSNLLAPTLVLRTQACHALGGFALAAASIPLSEVHTRISNIVASRFISPGTSNGFMSPLKDSTIIRTLRTTLVATDPKHPAQGPVWAWSVIANFVVLLGPAVYSDERLMRAITALFALGMRHQKSSVRALGCLAWRCMTWAYFHAPLIQLKPLEDESDASSSSETSDGEEQSKRAEEDHEEKPDWKVVQSVVDMGAGVATIGALLAGESTDELSLRRALGLLRGMSKKGGQTCKDALETAWRLVGLEEANPWDAQRLLARGLFCAIPGLLTVEYKALTQAVRPLLDQCTGVEDVRPLTREEIALEWVFDSLLDVWKEGLSALRLSWGSDIPGEISEVWRDLIKAPATLLRDSGDKEALMQFAERANKILIDLLEDPEVDLSLEPEQSVELSSPVKPDGTKMRKAPPAARWNLGLKLYLTRELWTSMKNVLPEFSLRAPAETLLKFLVNHETKLVGDVNLADQIRQQWTALCAEVVFACDAGELEKFWCGGLCMYTKRRENVWNAEVRQAVWSGFVEGWSDACAEWDAAVILLSVPFMELNAWEISHRDVEDWNMLLRVAMDKALDHGIDSVTVVDQIASIVSSNHSPTFEYSIHASDLLLSQLEINEARQVPEGVMQLVNNTLISTYPPEPRKKVRSKWLMRTLTRVLDACPVELAVGVYESLQEGLSLWIADEYKAFTPEEYAMDILPVYQTILIGIQSQPTSAATIETLAPIIESAFCGREDKPEAAVHAFEEFWRATYADTPEPLWGWPERIQTCLQKLARNKAETLAPAANVDNSAANEDGESEDGAGPSNDYLFSLSADEREKEELEISAAVLMPDDDGRSAFAPAVTIRAATPTSPLHPRVNLASPPVTPKSSARELPFTPLSPQLASAQNASSDLPATPLLASPATPKRTSRSASDDNQLSLERRRSTGNKENLPSVASVVERIAMRSPAATTTLFLGKRRMSDDEESDVVAKRSKVDPLSSTLAQEKFDVPAALDEPARFFQGVSDSSEHSVLLPKAPHPKLRRLSIEEVFGRLSEETIDGESAELPVAGLFTPSKRKGVFLDAVEVPTYEQVLRRERIASLRSKMVRTLSAPASAASSRTFMAERVLRRTHSSAVNAMRAEIETPPSKHRRTDLRAELYSTPSKIVRALRDAPMAGSDDSIMQASPEQRFSDQLSDDDPHTDCITPFGVVSPALRRARKDDTDPPSSDDSNEPLSPVREHVKRRIARLPSSKALLKPSPLKLRLRPLGMLSSDNED